MIFYLDVKPEARYTFTPKNSDRCTDDPIEARNILLAERLSISIDDLKHLMDDDWCRTHHQSLADVLNIYGAKQGFAIGGPDNW